MRQKEICYKIFRKKLIRKRMRSGRKIRNRGEEEEDEKKEGTQ